MTELEQMLFVRAKLLEGKTKKEARQACRKQVRLEEVQNTESKE